MVKVFAGFVVGFAVAFFYCTHTTSVQVQPRHEVPQVPQLPHSASHVSLHTTLI